MVRNSTPVRQALVLQGNPKSDNALPLRPISDVCRDAIADRYYLQTDPWSTGRDPGYPNPVQPGSACRADLRGIYS